MAHFFFRDYGVPRHTWQLWYRVLGIALKYCNSPLKSEIKLQCSWCTINTDVHSVNNWPSSSQCLFFFCGNPSHYKHKSIVTVLWRHQFKVSNWLLGDQTNVSPHDSYLTCGCGAVKSKPYNFSEFLYWPILLTNNFQHSSGGTLLNQKMTSRE